MVLTLISEADRFKTFWNDFGTCKPANYAHLKQFKKRWSYVTGMAQRP